MCADYGIIIQDKNDNLHYYLFWIKYAKYQILRKKAKNNDFWGKCM